MNTSNTGQRRIITPTEERSLKSVIEMEQAERTETDSTYPGGRRYSGNGDSKQVQRAKRELEQHSAENNKPNKHEVIRLEKRMRELTEWLQKNMLPESKMTEREQKDGYPNREFAKAANFMASKEMSQEFQKAASEWKWIARRLGRDSNLATIRPETN